MATDTALVKVLADNADLTRKLAQSQRQLKGFEARAKRAGKGASQSLAGTAAGAFGVVKAFDFLKGSVEKTKELTKATGRLEAITKTDAVTAGEWSMLAQERGISTDQLSTTFLALSRNMSKATNGGKTQVAAFDRLGISMSQVANQNPTDMMLTVADALKGIQNPAERATLANQLFGKQSKSLIGLLGNGSKKLKEQLGAFEGTSKQLAATSGQSKELIANQRKLDAAMLGVKVSLGAAFIPVLNKVTGLLTKFSNLSPGVKNMIITMLGFAAGAVAIMKVGNAIKGIAGAMRVLGMALAANPIGAAVTLIVIGATLVITHWKQVKAFLGRVWAWIKGAFKAGADFVIKAARRGFLGPVGWIITHWGQVVGFFKSLPGRLGGYASRAGSAIWRGIKRGASGVIGFFKGVANGVIGNIERFVNIGIRGLNRLIDLANKVPGVDIGKIGRVDLPRLAQGGVVRAPKVALIGEAGPEAVVPLSSRMASRRRQVMREAGLAGGGDNIFNIYNYGNQLDERQLAAKIGWQLAVRGVG